MLGERDEALEELRADLMDVKNLYKDQIEFMLERLAPPQQGLAGLKHWQPEPQPQPQPPEGGAGAAQGADASKQTS